MCRSIERRSRLADGRFLAQQATRQLEIARDEHVECQLHVRRRHGRGNVSSSFMPCPENEARALIFLLASSIRFLSMMSPICSRLVVNDRISMLRSPSSWIEFLAREPSQIELHRLVLAVDGIVLGLDPVPQVRHHCVRKHLDGREQHALHCLGDLQAWRDAQQEPRRAYRVRSHRETLIDRRQGSRPTARREADASMAVDPADKRQGEGGHHAIEGQMCRSDAMPAFEPRGGEDVDDHW